MFRRHPILPLSLAVALVACPEVERDPPRDRIVLAGDLTGRVIPLPNDLALLAAATLPDAAGVQKELLVSFVNASGFPSDQEVSVTVPIRTLTKDEEGEFTVPGPAPSLDLATVNTSTVALVHLNAAGGPAAVAFDEPAQAQTSCVSQTGAYPCTNLVLRRKPAADGSRRWDPGARYVVAVRGGPSGVKTTDGEIIGADAGIALIAANKDLSLPQNQPPGGLDAAQVQLLETSFATGLNLGLRDFYNDRLDWTRPAPNLWVPAPAASVPSAFEGVATVFPHQEIASIQTFEAQPVSARPVTDAGSGQIPFPSDFLLETDPEACADVRAPGDTRPCVTLNEAAFGPAAAGLHTLDGFSTTAPLLIPLTAPVQASTITRDNVRIYKLTPGPVELTAAQIVTRPAAVQSGAATTIALAPAVAVEGVQGVPNFYVPPLDESSTYLVLVTNGVLDVQGQPLRRSTLMDLVFTFSSPLYDAANDRSLVPGVAAGDAAGLQALRDELGAVVDALAPGDSAVLAYTVTTQSVKGVSTRLSALPYGVELAAGPTGAAVFVPDPTTILDFSTQEWLGIPDDVFTNADLGGSVHRFFQFYVPTVNAIDPATGGLDPTIETWTPTQFLAALEQIPVLLAVPKVERVAGELDCAAGVKCVPLVVFQHGIFGSRYQMVTLVNELTERGFAVAAIDQPYHGDRSFCDSNDDCTVSGTDAGTCTPDPERQTPVDAVAPGTCTGGSRLKLGTGLTHTASGNYWVSTNFFRTRDAIRQHLIDHSALHLALARPPEATPWPQPTPSATSLAARLATAYLATPPQDPPPSTTGVAIDPRRVYFGGLSLGGIVGTSVVATNPRYKRAALANAGGTLVDVFTTSPAFQPQLAPLFGALGINVPCALSGTGCDPAVPNDQQIQASKYAQITSVAKWVLDPADPINYAAHLEQKVLADELAALAGSELGSTTTDVFAQLVTGDLVVPNPTSRLLYNLAPGLDDFTYTSAASPPTSLHNLLLTTDFNPATNTAQEQAGAIVRDDFASFLHDLLLPAADPVNVP